MTHIKLTIGGGFYDGKPTYINAENIIQMYEHKSAEDGLFNTAIEMVGKHHHINVKETIDSVMKLFHVYHT